MDNPKLIYGDNIRCDITLRDLYAGLAMQVMHVCGYGGDADDKAKWSFEQADAMLKAREST